MKSIAVKSDGRKTVVKIQNVPGLNILGQKRRPEAKCTGGYKFPRE
jgi:hypothetical protein